MARFRGSDERLEREIETLESIAKLRVRRAARELQDLHRELNELRRERARRRAAATATLTETGQGSVEA